MDAHNIFNGAAALAFFLLLAIFPAAIFLLTLLPYLSIPHLEEAIMELLRQALPGDSAGLFAGAVHHVITGKKGGLLVFGLIFMLWSASAGIYAIMEELNAAYGVRESRPFWKVRAAAMLLMLLFVLLVVGSLSLVIFGGMVQAWVASIIGWSRPLLLLFATLRWVIIGASLLLGLSVIYRFGPDVQLKFRFISPGNVAGACLIILASIGFRFYVSIFGNFSATYGSLGAIIILMLWLYFAGIALLVGGEIDAILHLAKSRNLTAQH